MLMKTKKYRYTGKDFDIKTAPTKVKDSADDLKKIKKKIKKNVKSIKNAQKMMYARRHYGVLVVFQAMDAAGKDSMISHIFAGVNPVGFKVANFKQPTGRELRHDYLWRINRELPMRGDIGVFNRSYYEDVLVSRVHPALILQSNIPGIESVHDVNNKFFDSRYEDIRQYESYLTRNGYQKAYEKAINATATKENLWYVIPADDKWYSRLIVSDILTKKINSLPLAYPEVSPEQEMSLRQARKELMAEDK